METLSYDKIYRLFPWELKGEQQGYGPFLVTGASLAENSSNSWNFVYLLATKDQGQQTQRTIDSLKRLEDSSLEASFNLAPSVTWKMRIEEVSWEEVAANPSEFGLSDEEGKLITSSAALNLYVTSERIPSWYEDLVAPPPTSPVAENATVTFGELDEERKAQAKPGDVHFWASKNRWYIKREDGSWEPLEPNDRWLDSHPSLPEDSLAANTDSNGELKAERKRLHDSVVKDLFAGKRPTDKPKAVFTMGVPASGKSSMSRLSREDPNLVTLDADDHRSKLPEYQAAQSLRASNGAKIVHREASMINDRALEQAMAEDPENPGKRYSFLMDGVGRNPDFYAETMRRAKELGYEIVLKMAHVKDSETMAAGDIVKLRAAERGERTGRFVSSDVIDNVLEVIPANFMKLLPLTDNASVVDTTDLDNPFPIFHKQGESIEGSMNWMNEAMDDSEISDPKYWLNRYIEALKADNEAHKNMPKKHEQGQGMEDPLLDLDGNDPYAV